MSPHPEVMNWLLLLWLAGCDCAVEVEIDGEACRAVVESVAAGTPITVERVAGQRELVTHVACVPPETRTVRK